MRKGLLVLILLSCVAITLPMTAAALGLDVEVKAGLGLAMGSTDNPNITGGSPRIALGGGLGADFYILTLGPVDLGLAASAELSYMANHSTWTNGAGPGIDVTTEGAYNYLIFPVSLVGSVPVAPSTNLVIHAGVFFGYFMGGVANNSFSSPFIPPNSAPLDSSNTNQWETGIHVTAGTDIALRGNLSLAPSLQFDMGLTDITVNNATQGSYKDTLWSLAVMVGLKYKVF